METNPLKSRKNTGSLIIYILIVSFGLIAGYLLYTQFLKEAGLVIPAPNIKTNDSLAKFKDAKVFDFEFFNNHYFQSLKLLGEAPVRPGQTGKNDLFAPF